MPNISSELLFKIYQKLVFGVKIIGTEHTPSKSINKASSILVQWLDNDNDGKPDNKIVIDALIQGKEVTQIRIVSTGTVLNSLMDLIAFH